MKLCRKYNGIAGHVWICCRILKCVAIVSDRSELGGDKGVEAVLSYMYFEGDPLIISNVTEADTVIGTDG